MNIVVLSGRYAFSEAAIASMSWSEINPRDDLNTTLKFIFFCLEVLLRIRNSCCCTK